MLIFDTNTEVLYSKNLIIYISDKKQKDVKNLNNVQFHKCSEFGENSED